VTFYISALEILLLTYLLTYIMIIMIMNIIIIFIRLNESDNSLRHNKYTKLIIIYIKLY